jgi:hypothetical protein
LTVRDWDLKKPQGWNLEAQCRPPERTKTSLRILNRHTKQVTGKPGEKRVRHPVTHRHYSTWQPPVPQNQISPPLNKGQENLSNISRIVTSIRIKQNHKLIAHHIQRPTRRLTHNSKFQTNISKILQNVTDDIDCLRWNHSIIADPQNHRNLPHGLSPFLLRLGFAGRIPNVTSTFLPETRSVTLKVISSTRISQLRTKQIQPITPTHLILALEPEHNLPLPIPQQHPTHRLETQLITHKTNLIQYKGISRINITPNRLSATLYYCNLYQPAKTVEAA